MNAVTIYGGGALRKDIPKAARVALGVILVLVGFSRLYLGVHTPQDVLVGAVTGLPVMWLTMLLVRWVDEHPERDSQVMYAGIALAATVAIYAAFKPYPMDHDSVGVLLMDGAKMANDTFRGVGWCVGILFGWILERRLIRFSTDVNTATKINRAVIGMLGYYIVSLILMPLMKEWIAGPTGSLLSCFLQTFYIMFLLPWMMERQGQESV